MCNFSFYSTSSSRGVARGKKLLFWPLLHGGLTSHPLVLENEYTTLHKPRSYHSHWGLWYSAEEFKVPLELANIMALVEIAFFWGSNSWCRGILYPSSGPRFYILFLALYIVVNTETPSHQDWPVPSKAEQALVPASISGFLFLLCFLFVWFYFVCFFAFVFGPPEISNSLVSSAIPYVTRKMLILYRVLLLLIIIVIQFSVYLFQYFGRIGIPHVVLVFEYM